MTFLVNQLTHRTSHFLPSQIRSIASKMTHPSDALAGSDPHQIRLMSEQVILVDPSDRVIGSMSKKDSHLISNDLPLHRAFSVFLFDSQARMLLQQRAPTKITFPSYWTNTVCSHPLHNPLELGLQDNADEITGVKRAALRKLSHELGVPNGAIQLHHLHYLTRIHYRAHCDDGLWGEHEIDYVFFAQNNVHLMPEPNEVAAVRYVTEPELKSLFRDADTSRDLQLTPWFRYIVDGFAWKWWRVLRERGLDGLAQCADPATIHRVGE